MKFNFKPLSSFFKSTTTEEEKDKKEEKKAGDDQGNDQGDDQGDNGDDQGDDQGETEKETGDDQGNDDKKESAKNANKSGKDAVISISQADYKAFVAAEMELQKFGKNAEDRNNFLKDATQLQVWYQAAIGAGATSNSDANAQEKNTKKQSKVTADAKAAYEKAAASKKK